MLICLEGVDGAGKSTLAAAIIKELGKKHPHDTITYLHAAQIDSDIYQAYHTPLESYSPKSGQHIILDRWHVGEQIYGPLYRGKSQFNNQEYVWIEMFLGSIGARLWNITQPLEVLQKRLADRGEDFLQENHVDFVRESFVKETSKSAIFAGEVSPNEDNVYILAEHIILDAEYAEGMADYIHSFETTYVGSTFTLPRTLLVTDNKKVNKGFKPNISEEANIFLANHHWEFVKDLGVVSSVSQENLKNFIDYASMTSGIITYSKTASARMTANGIGHILIDEPSTDRGYVSHVIDGARKAEELP